MNNALTSKSRLAIDPHTAKAGKGQLFLTAVSAGRSAATHAAADIYDRISDVLGEKGAVIVHERIFGSLHAEREIIAGRKLALGNHGIPSDWPVTYIDGSPPDGPGLAGVIIRAIVPQSTGDVWTIFDNGTPSGRGWRRNGSQFIILQNIQDRTNAFHPHLTFPIKGEGSNSDFPAFQIQQTIERAERILREQGASYRDVVRTWFYLSDILGWYPEFNRIRNLKYSEFGIMPDQKNDHLLLPSSTAVGGRNPQVCAASMDLIAITGSAKLRPSIKQLTNAHQLDAFRYGSAFSRGTLIRESDVTTIEVSGTSAIDEAGRSRYPGDIRSQIAYTLDNVQSLLNQEGADLSDIAAATVFVKQAEDASLFRKIIAARGIEELPAVCVVADICRDELLFEMDAEVVIKKGKEP